MFLSPFFVEAEVQSCRSESQASTLKAEGYCSKPGLGVSPTYKRWATFVEATVHRSHSISFFLQVFVGSFGSRKDEMVTYLQRVVGLNQKKHAVAVADDVKITSATNIASMNLTPSHRQLTLCVEGNISAGKSTFLAEIIRGSARLKVFFLEIPVCPSVGSANPVH
jgi:hypothetical protein